MNVITLQILQIHASTTEISRNSLILEACHISNGRQLNIVMKLGWIWIIHWEKKILESSNTMKFFHGTMPI